MRLVENRVGKERQQRRVLSIASLPKTKQASSTPRKRQPCLLYIHEASLVCSEPKRDLTRFVTPTLKHMLSVTRMVVLTWSMNEAAPHSLVPTYLLSICQVWLSIYDLYDLVRPRLESLPEIIVFNDLTNQVKVATPHAGHGYRPA